MSDTDPEAGRIHILDDLADRLAKLERLLPGRKDPDPGPGDEPEAGKPESIEAQVRAELERRDREKADAEKADAEKAEKESLAQRLAKLEESPPAEPNRRSTRLLGWGK